MNRKVLIVEDDADLARLVSLHLGDIGCEVTHAADGVTGLDLAAGGAFDLIILDLMLPGMSGMEICHSLRTRSSYTPILMLTAKSTELDRISGLEAGADDYLTKPFSILELVARVKAVFRRMAALSGEESQAPRGTLEVGDLVIDIDRRQVCLGDNELTLTAREFDLLLHFARSPGRVYTRAQLLDSVWGYSHSGYEHTVNSHINRLRAKIELDPRNPCYIKTVWGAGYKLAESRQV
ncbi:MAG: response regulator transcription factor [Xanthomonadales bacterium]|nr:response regulator transcription factor [Xanthomonadales bacterium]